MLSNKVFLAFFLILFLAPFAPATTVDCSNLIPTAHCDSVTAGSACIFYCETSGGENGSTCAPPAYSGSLVCTSEGQKCGEGEEACGCPEKYQCQSNALIECCPPNIEDGSEDDLSVVECRGNNNDIIHIEVVNPLSCSAVYGNCCKTMDPITIDCEALCDEALVKLTNGAYDPTGPGVGNNDAQGNSSGNKCDDTFAADGCITGSLSCACDLLPGTIPTEGGDPEGGPGGPGSGPGGNTPGKFPKCLPYANLHADPTSGPKPLDVGFTGTCVCYKQPGNQPCVPTLCESCILDFDDPNNPGQVELFPTPTPPGYLETLDWGKADHTYTDYGLYNPTLVATDSAGQTASDSTTITVGVPPVANAGPDRAVGDNELVTLDGSASYDLDECEFGEFPDPGEPGAAAPFCPDTGTAGNLDCCLEYSWSCTGCESGSCPAWDAGSSATDKMPFFTSGNDNDVCEFQLTVTDEQGLTDSDTVTVTIDSGVFADAGPDIAVLTCAPVSLDGSGSYNVIDCPEGEFLDPFDPNAQNPPFCPDDRLPDPDTLTDADPDNDEACCLIYEWVCLSGNCPDWTVPEAQAHKNPDFVARCGDAGEVYSYKLTVRTASGLSASDTVNVYVFDTLPEGNIDIKLNVAPVPLPIGTSFTVANAQVSYIAFLASKAVGEVTASFAAPPDQVYVKAYLRNAKTNLAVGNVFQSADQPLPAIVDFRGRLGENSLPLGNYRLFVEVYDAVSNDLLGSKSLSFSVFDPNAPVFVPELSWLLIPVLLAAILLLYRQSSKPSEKK